MLTAPDQKPKHGYTLQNVFQACGIELTSAAPDEVLLLMAGETLADQPLSL